MRRRVLGSILAGALLFPGGLSRGQNSFQTLEQELNEAKQKHQDVTAETETNFFTQVDAAMASPDAAIALYQQAGGALPPPTPVVSEHENETVTEKGARLAIDQANLTRLGLALELHCGMLHYAALFVTKPDQKGLQDDWASWLKTAAESYTQITPATDGDASASPSPHHHRKKGDDGESPGPAQPGSFNPSDIKEASMRDSIISKFLAFKAWGDKEQGEWSVAQLPKLYETNVLTPLRNPPTATTLAAWDVYIAMMGADTTDDQWNQNIYPPLQFERACDDYAVTPSTEKLEDLVKLVNANPTYPKLDDWISRVHKLMEDYRASHGGGSEAAATPATNAPPSDPNVNVSTVQQGDTTIITTHTNAAPVTNAAPTP